MTRVPCGSEEKADGLKKGPWTPDEDHKLLAYIQKHGHGSWRSLPLNAGLQRCGKSCRLRWTNYLKPDIKRGRFSHEEDQLIIHLHAILGNRWSAISSYLPRRTDNEIKNYWNTHLKKRLLQMGIDPVTHKPTVEEEQLLLDSIIPELHPLVSSNLTHMSQWDSFRAEAEARLSRQSTTSGSNFQQQRVLPNQASSDSSTTFMSLWKAQVAETLRPSFGVVELDKPTTLIRNHDPFNFQTFQQDWESSLERPPAFSTCGSPIDIPDLSSDTPSGTVSPQYRAQGPKPVFPTSEQITERLLATSQCRNYFELDQNNTMYSSLDSDYSHSQSLSAAGSMPFSFAGVYGDSSESQFSPTSTLYDHDSSYSNSPCNSNFDVLAHPFQDGSSEQSTVHNLVFPLGPASFWSPQVAMTTTVDAGFSFGGAVPMLNSVVGVPNNIPIPQFDSLM